MIWRKSAMKNWATPRVSELYELYLCVVMNLKMAKRVFITIRAIGDG